MSELIYRGSGEPHDGIKLLPPPPPWRSFTSGPLERIPSYSPGAAELNRAKVYRPSPEAVDMINAALLLRRPLLVTGPEGTGKSSLAYSIAYELGLGPVLYWPINRSSTLGQGLYHYDAIGRTHEANLYQAPDDIGSYIRLGPLGTALLPSSVPRVLLIDEIDKSDIDLPSDLLTVFEAGGFEIPELVRIDDRESAVEVLAHDAQRRVVVNHGRVSCGEFPMVVLTSYGGREFPPQFLRRCLQLELSPPDSKELAEIVTAHLGEDLARQSQNLIAQVASRDDRPTIDQLLNAIYLASSGIGAAVNGERVREALLQVVEEDGWA